MTLASNSASYIQQITIEAAVAAFRTDCQQGLSVLIFYLSTTTDSYCRCFIYY